MNARPRMLLKALRILAGCPDGATEDALARHGITRAALWDLVADGHATVQTQRFGKLKHLEVDRFRITPRGRSTLPPGSE
jgi:hypothetical protein